MCAIREWNELPFADLEVELQVRTPLCLPEFSGSVLRTALELAVRNLVCVSPKQQDCQGCPAWNPCAYRRLFVSAAEGKARFIPYRPCIAWFDAPSPGEFSPDDTIILRLRLFGTAVEYYPYFVFALERMGAKGIGLRNAQGQRGSFSPAAIRQVLPDRTELLYSIQQDRAVSPLASLPVAEYLACPDTNRIRLRTLSPLRVMRDGSFDDRLEFPTLFGSILRRADALYLHTYGEASGLDFSGLLAEASQVKREQPRLRWKDYERFSSRQRDSMLLGGVTGDVVYEGVTPRLLPFLRFGELAAVGKGISFGFGRFAICG